MIGTHLRWSGTFLYCDFSYDRLEALIYFSDITENYFSEQIPHMLYRKNFDRIEIIDGQRDCVRLDHPGICAMEMVLAEEISYSGYVTEVMKRFVPDDEKSVYDKCVRLDTIRKVDILSLFISLIRKGRNV